MWSLTVFKQQRVDRLTSLLRPPAPATDSHSHDLLRMAAPRIALSVFVLLLAVICLTEGMRGAGPKKCCFVFNEKKVRHERVVSYKPTSQRCINSAVLLKTIGGQFICVKPSTPWVKELMSIIDARVAPGQATNL